MELGASYTTLTDVAGRGHDKGDYTYHYTSTLYSLHWIDTYGHEVISQYSY